MRVMRLAIRKSLLGARHSVPLILFDLCRSMSGTECRAPGNPPHLNEEETLR